MKIFVKAVFLSPLLLVCVAGAAFAQTKSHVVLHARPVRVVRVQPVRWSTVVNVTFGSEGGNILNTAVNIDHNGLISSGHPGTDVANQSNPCFKNGARLTTSSLTSIATLLTKNRFFQMPNTLPWHPITSTGGKIRNPDLSSLFISVSTGFRTVMVKKVVDLDNNPAFQKIWHGLAQLTVQRTLMCQTYLR